MQEVSAGSEGAFSSVLSVADRDRLRLIVRHVHLRYYPQDKLTNYECDKLIDAWGPDVAGRMIKAAVDRGLVG
jgi:hypothetical protein